MAAEHVERRRVSWIDTDAGGRIHFTAAFRWAEAAETELMRAAGLLDREWADYPRRHVEADYRRVLVFDDEIDVRIRADRLGATSITYAWTVARGGEICIEGRHTVVHVDREGRPAALPERVRAAFAAGR
ncbi:MAG: acyl-CoA thioesterase [Gaiellaceae bacterium]